MNRMGSGKSHDEQIAAHVQEIVEAAREFVATTSYYRQRKESRAEFERLAYALLALRDDEAKRLEAALDA